MRIILASPSAFFLNGVLDQKLVDVFRRLKAHGNPVAVVSNRAEPDWFKSAFDGSQVQFLTANGRQDGIIVKENAARLQLQPFDSIVLAMNRADVAMAKNGGAVLVGARWSSEDYVREQFIPASNAADFEQAVALSAQWQGNWWCNATDTAYRVVALADLSGYHTSQGQQVFGSKLTTTVKQGGPRLAALLAVCARSWLMDGSPAVMWGVYPSSSSSNADQDTLSEFVHRLRTTTTKVRLAQRGHPLFIRHKPSSKRSAGGGAVDRSDPTEQLATIHINPKYGSSVRGRNVVVVDDCTTYGVSFGVAAGLLLAAGAQSVTGLALGKFGNRLRRYDIQVNCDPFAPLDLTKCKWSEGEFKQVAVNQGAQNQLIALIP